MYIVEEYMGTVTFKRNSEFVTLQVSKGLGGGGGGRNDLLAAEGERFPPKELGFAHKMACHYEEEGLPYGFSN